MNRTLKKVLIGAGLVIGLVLVLLVVYMLKFRSETGKMSPLDTRKIDEVVYSVKDDFVNLYLIESNGNYIAIDAGNNVDQVERELKKTDIEWQKVMAVFLTHSDSDHVSATALFKNAKVFLPKAEEQMINGQTNRFAIFGNSLDSEYELVDDNQIVNILDQTILCISTPGHTPGSMSYLVNNKYLFTGDSMSLKNGAADLFNEFFNMDSENQRKSLKKLATLKNIKYVFTAHYGLSDNYGKTFDGFK